MCYLLSEKYIIYFLFDDGHVVCDFFVFSNPAVVLLLLLLIVLGRLGYVIEYFVGLLVRLVDNFATEFLVVFDVRVCVCHVVVELLGEETRGYHRFITRSFHHIVKSG